MPPAKTIRSKKDVRITELDLSKRSASSWVVDDLLNHTSQITVSLSIIELAEGGRVLVQASVRSEDRAC